MDIQDIITIALALHAIASIFVGMTDTPKDDEALARYYKFIEKIAGVTTKTKQGG